MGGRGGEGDKKTETNSRSLSHSIIPRGWVKAARHISRNIHHIIGLLIRLIGLYPNPMPHPRLEGDGQNGFAFFANYSANCKASQHAAPLAVACVWRRGIMARVRNMWNWSR